MSLPNRGKSTSTSTSTSTFTQTDPHIVVDDDENASSEGYTAIIIDGSKIHSTPTSLAQGGKETARLLIERARSALQKLRSRDLCTDSHAYVRNCVRDVRVAIYVPLAYAPRTTYSIGGVVSTKTIGEGRIVDKGAMRSSSEADTWPADFITAFNTTSAGVEIIYSPTPATRSLEVLELHLADQSCKCVIYGGDVKDAGFFELAYGHQKESKGRMFVAFDADWSEEIMLMEEVGVVLMNPFQGIFCGAKDGTDEDGEQRERAFSPKMGTKKMAERVGRRRGGAASPLGPNGSSAAVQETMMRADDTAEFDDEQDCMIKASERQAHVGTDLDTGAFAGTDNIPGLVLSTSESPSHSPSTSSNTNTARNKPIRPIAPSFRSVFPGQQAAGSKRKRCDMQSHEPPSCISTRGDGQTLLTAGAEADARAWAMLGVEEFGKAFHGLSKGARKRRKRRIRGLKMLEGMKLEL